MPIYRSEFPLDKLFVLFAMFFTYLFLSVDTNMSEGYRRFIVILLILILIYFQFGRFGRDDLVGVTLGFLVYRSRLGHISFLSLLWVPVIIMFGWMIFSPYELSLYEMVLSIFNRIGTQTAFVYFHIDYVPSMGLMDDGVDTWWSSGKNINPSKLVFEDFYGRSGGSTAGYSFAKLWYVFKWLALPFVFVMFLLLFSLDRLLYQSKQIHSLNHAPRAIHAMFVTFTTIPLLFNLTTVFSYQYVLSTMSLVLLSLIALFYKVKLLRRVKR